MNSIRRAVIDVGTNSVKLLVADVAGRDVRPVREESKQTRLGQGFYETHRLQPGAIAQTAAAVTAFAATARQHGAVSVRVFATSAARDAQNHAELTLAIERAAGLKAEIISGEREADWAFQGVSSDPALASEPLLLLDVGGGSSQFILGRGDQRFFCRSFQLGTVRLLEKFPHADPPAAAERAALRRWIGEFLAEQVRPKLDPALRRASKPETGSHHGPLANSGGVQLIGTGGTATILGRIALALDSFDRERIEAAGLSLNQVREIESRLWNLPLVERKRIPGLPANRADVILSGVVIFEAVMEQFGFHELRLSTRGLRFAAVMDGV